MTNRHLIFEERDALRAEVRSLRGVVQAVRAILDEHSFVDSPGCGDRLVTVADVRAALAAAADAPQPEWNEKPHVLIGCAHEDHAFADAGLVGRIPGGNWWEVCRPSSAVLFEDVPDA